MAKRGASSELNHDNWDRDEEPEESGTFEKAPDEIIKKRTIKIAKRRNPISTQQNDDNKSNIFGGFTAFTKSSPNNNNNKNAFGFLSNLTTKNSDNNNDDCEKQTNGTSINNEQTKSDEYYAKLKGLNESVSAWIKQHVTENPLINLQPIFKDYDRYFAELEKLKDTSIITTTATTTAAVATTVPQFNFGTATSSSSSNKNYTTTATTTLPKFSFGTTSPGKFSFGATPTTTPSAATFSFGSKPSSTLDSTVTVTSENTTNLSLSSSSSNDLTTKPSIFGNTTTSFTNPIISSTLTDDNNKTNVDNDNVVDTDEPPKVDFTPVVEKDHIYMVRCKLFVKKDGNFGDRGVGTLYLKSIPNNEKIQLILRADTNLGNLLCNFILSDSIPIKRMGKKDVMLVCLPTPEHKPPPVPILLRVKSPEEADELLNTLEKHKK